jgi:leucyl-tRNA synthetase
MINKITNNLEAFNYNVIIANIYEIYNFINKIIDKEINGKILKQSYKKILILISPVVPHYSTECLSDLKILENVEWPKTDKSLLVEDKIDYVIQINGKKRAILNENRDIDQDSLMNKIKLNKLSEKYLKDKSIKKIIFVKNRLINLLINE